VKNCGAARTAPDGTIIVTAPTYRWLSSGLGFFVSDGRYVSNPFYQKSRYSDAFDIATGVLFAGPLVVMAGIELAGTVIALEGASTGWIMHGTGRFGQIRFGRDKLILRLDRNKPNTHVNVQGRLGSKKFNFHIPPRR